MSETVVKNDTCQNCSADVRKGALFCYNCGGSVSPTIKVSEEQGNFVSADFSPNRKNAKKDTAQTASKIDEAPEKKEAEENSISAVDIDETKLKSAASIRKRPKTVVKKEVKIVWKEHDDAPNIWFIAVAGILTIAVAAVIWLALYLR